MLGWVLIILALSNVLINCTTITHYEIVIVKKNYMEDEPPSIISNYIMNSEWGLLVSCSSVPYSIDKE